ncbi:DUF1127 domain-containing protein [Bosea sp. (in: a-proteobacteria)]|uniref:DUF1127 domain-containing protein n=1 Tax=Bosea sp. (in: a-proteobacteria) TaxID=1871050 RepID=UPI0025C62BEA|nr:DUF1127 domain-containing protein [Bosea sp. (in: a-proteobacteria)]
MLIMTYAAKSLSALGGSVTRAAIRTVTGVKKLIRAWVHRREVMQLGELDERGLKDIGLVRSDVEGALATSWLRDPSVVLSARSAQQQSAAARRREVGLRQAVTQPARAARAIEIACNA